MNSLSISKLWKYGLVACFILILFVTVTGVMWKNHSTLSAPDVVFMTIKGEKIALKSLRGKPVLVTFWATDCPSCVKEVNDFIDLYQQFHQQGLEIIAVAMYYDLPNHVVEMTTVKKIPYHVALDLRSEQATAFGKVELTPTTFLINPAGQIVFRTTGRFDMADMRQRLQQLFAIAQ
jgi:peroxiredoxin